MFLHIDLDAFFINAARTKEPSLRGVSAAVISGNCVDIFGDFLPPGMVLSASYEARAKGIKCTMQAATAQKIDPQIKLVSTDFALYKKLSKEVFNVLYDYTNEIEKYSIDEYFLDLRGTSWDNEPSALASIIKNRIESELALPCSLGTAPHKWWAKLATSLAKPAGIKHISSFDEIGTALLRDFAGAGKASLDKLNKEGIITLNDAKNSRPSFERLGKAGLSLWEHICGSSGDYLRKENAAKSLSIARTFERVFDRAELKRRIRILAKHLHIDLAEQNLVPKKLEIRFAYEHSKTTSHTFSADKEFTQTTLASEFWQNFCALDNSPRLGVVYISLGSSDFSGQKGLFWQQKSNKQKALDDALLKLQNKYGSGLI